MKALFFVLTTLPIGFVRYAVNLYVHMGFHKPTELYRITLINITLCYPSLSNKERVKLANQSVIETVVSGYESMLSWSRPIHISGKKIFKIENNYLLSQNVQKNNGLIIIAIHNRSVDMLLKWINSKSKTISLYKKIKNKTLDSFVRNEREKNNNETYETSVSGVRKIFKSLLSKNVICLAADQVPQAGMGEYVKFFNRDAYTTTLAPSLAYKTGKPVIYCSMNSDNNKNLFVSIKSCNSDIYSYSKRILSMNNSIENLININPKDYSWEYKRFKKAKSKNTDPYLKG